MWSFLEASAEGVSMPPNRGHGRLARVPSLTSRLKPSRVYTTLSFDTLQAGFDDLLSGAGGASIVIF